MEIYEFITEQLARLLAIFAAGLVLYLAPKVREWFMSSSDKNTQERVHQMVIAFTKAAEQLFHDTDPSGAKRHNFVRKQLSALGVEVTEGVLNMIEGAVWEINSETNKVRVQAKQVVSTIVNAPDKAMMQEAPAPVPSPEP